MPYRPTERTEARKEARASGSSPPRWPRWPRAATRRPACRRSRPEPAWPSAPSTGTSRPRPSCSPRSSAGRGARAGGGRARRSPTTGGQRASASPPRPRRSPAAPSPGTPGLRAARRAGRPRGRGRAAAAAPRLPRRLRAARCTRASGAGEIRPTTPPRWPPRWSARWARPWSARWPTAAAGDHDALVASLVKLLPSDAFPRRRSSPHEPSPGASADTHEVLNQPPPLAPYNVFEADLALREAVEREGGDWGVDRLRDTGALAGSPEAIEHSERCRAQRAGAAHPRPLRQPRRRGRARPVLALAAARRRSSARSTRCPGAIPRPGAHVVRAGLMYVWSQVNSGVMCPVSMTYSVIPALRENEELAAEWEPRLTLPRLRARRAGRHGDDREAGRLGRARQHHLAPSRRATDCTRSPATSGSAPTRPCDVFLTLAQAPGGPVLLPDRGRRPRLPRPAAEGQARHPLAALVRGRVPRRAGPPGRRGGPRRADDHPDGQPHPAGLPDRLGGLDALGHRPGRAPRPPPVGLRHAAGRAAADAERAGRPGDRVRGRHGHRHAGGARLRRGRRGRSAASPPR